MALSPKDLQDKCVVEADELEKYIDYMLGVLSFDLPSYFIALGDASGVENLAVQRAVRERYLAVGWSGVEFSEFFDLGKKAWGVTLTSK